MNLSREKLQQIVEGALLVYGQPMTVGKLLELFMDEEGLPEGAPGKEEIQAALEDIQSECKNKGYELQEVSSGYRFQVKQELAPWINNLWEEKPQKYSRALMETLALIAYRQPITRGDIEEIRGVAVSSTIIRTLIEREWVRVVGHRDVPGRPALYATTRQFLDYFNLKNLEDLPPLGEIKDLDQMNGEFEFSEGIGIATPDEEVATENPQIMLPIGNEPIEELGAAEQEEIEALEEQEQSHPQSDEDQAIAEKDLIDPETDITQDSSSDKMDDKDIANKARMSFAAIVQRRFAGAQTPLEPNEQISAPEQEGPAQSSKNSDVDSSDNSSDNSSSNNTDEFFDVEESILEQDLEDPFTENFDFVEITEEDLTEITFISIDAEPQSDTQKSDDIIEDEFALNPELTLNSIEENR